MTKEIVVQGCGDYDPDFDDEPTEVQVLPDYERGEDCFQVELTYRGYQQSEYIYLPEHRLRVLSRVRGCYESLIIGVHTLPKPLPPKLKLAAHTVSVTKDTVIS